VARLANGRSGTSKSPVAEMPLDAKNSYISGTIGHFINICRAQAFTNEPGEN
jgi:hypothetical protein